MFSKDIEAESSIDKSIFAFSNSFIILIIFFRFPFLIVSLLFLIIGGIAGFFGFTYLSSFEMKSYSVNGEVSQEKDYIIVDMSQIKAINVAE